MLNMAAIQEGPLSLFVDLWMVHYKWEQPESIISLQTNLKHEHTII